MNLRKKLIKLFITFIVLFGVLMNPAVAISSDELYLLPQSICEEISPNNFFYKPQSLLPVQNIIFPKSLTIDQVQDIEKYLSSCIQF
jgi:hypothetical protein